MPTKTVIVHGWSDCSESFADLKKYLIKEGVGDVDTIYYADYESREDSVTFDDVIDGLNDRFLEEGFIDAEGTAKHDLNIIVHSTGGLIIRHWIARYYLDPKVHGGDPKTRLAQCPVKRIVMLAPANFGSPLAHRGKSFLGNLFKGRWKIGDFLEVGRNLLEGLELASPYQWDLAHQDLLATFAPYAADRIQLTILVGINDYTGMRGWVNKPGTDGTVVIAGTSLDSLKLCLDCTKPSGDGDDYIPYAWSQSKAVDDFAWGVLPDLDHGSIVSDAPKSLAGPILLRALKAKDAAAFRAHATNLQDVTRATYAAFPSDKKKPKYQQFIVHAIDDQDNSIADFTLEFFICRARRAKDGLITRDSRLTAIEQSLSDEANYIITREFHPHSVDPSFRRFLINLDELRALIERAKGPAGEGGLGEAAALSMRVYVPRVDKGIEYAVKQLQNIVLVSTEDKKAGPSFLFENTTTLLELRVDRRNNYVRLATKPLNH
jgi:pimeloyl-ACP methyl ester carboxylesterase